jgi:flagellar hook-associated protein 3 FlgL
MIRNLDPSAERFLVDLRHIQSVTERAHRQISSGLRVAAPSDAPDQIGDILQIHAGILRAGQIRVNLGRLQTETGAAEDALDLAAKIMDRARVLGSQGAGSTETGETRRILAGEVQALLEQLVSASRTMVENRYVFSGDRDHEPAYEFNLANPGGVERRFTTQATRRVEHPNGASFEVARTAQEIFDLRLPDDTSAPENVFAALNSLRVALESDDQTAIDAALPALRLASDYLNRMLSFYGSVQRKVDEAVDAASKLEMRLKVELGGKRDADLTAAILELQQGAAQEEAALGARAQMPRTSLFDYLG